MGNSIDQQVIDFTATYTGTSPGEISNSTVLASLGIITQTDLVSYIENLEENLGS